MKFRFKFAPRLPFDPSSQVLSQYSFPDAFGIGSDFGERLCEFSSLHDYVPNVTLKRDQVFINDRINLLIQKGTIRCALGEISGALLQGHHAG
jgi:hypothetical protein